MKSLRPAGLSKECCKSNEKFTCSVRTKTLSLGFLKEFFPGHQSSSLHKLTASKTRQVVKKKEKTHYPTYFPQLSVFWRFSKWPPLIWECARKALGKDTPCCKSPQLIPAQIHWVSHLLCPKFLCLGWPASLLHPSNQTGSHVRYFTALTWQGHVGRETTQSRNGKKKITGIELLNSTLRTVPHFWEQTRSSQPQNPQKELKSKEVRAAEIKQNSQLQGNTWNHIVSFCNFVFSPEFQWCQWWSALVMVQRCIEEPIFKNWPVKKLQNYCQSQ